MKLQKIEINLIPSYADNAGRYKAEIKYQNTHGTVDLILDPKVSEALLVCIGQTVQEFATNAAKALQESIGQSLLEASKMPAIEVASNS